MCDHSSSRGHLNHPSVFPKFYHQSLSIDERVEQIVLSNDSEELDPDTDKIISVVESIFMATSFVSPQCVYTDTGLSC